MTLLFFTWLTFSRKLEDLDKKRKREGERWGREARGGWRGKGPVQFKY